MPQNDVQPSQGQQTPISFLMAHKDALAKLPPEKQIKLVDVLFRRFVQPRLQKGNMPPSEEEMSKLKLQFMSRVFGIPSDGTDLEGPKEKPGILKKGAAALEGGGAGVLGGVKNITDLAAKVDEYLKLPTKDLNKKVHNILGEAEGKAYSDASAIDPKVASASAAVGHQIPAALAAEGAGAAVGAGAGMARVGKASPLLVKAGVGAVKGAAEGGAFEAARPGGSPSSGAGWGAMLGAAFPILGSAFGLGKRTVSKAAEAGAEVPKAAPVAAAAPATEAPKSMGDLATQLSQKHFNKAFKDLSSQEREKLPDLIKQEILTQRSTKAQAAKVIKEGKDAAKAAASKEKQEAAQAKAAAQAAKRKAGETSATVTAAKASQENPQVAKAVTTVKESIKEPEVKKIPEGQRGTQKPGSPAKQAADRERISKKREEATRTETMTSLESQARQLAGRYTPASLGQIGVPELEDAMKELPNGSLFLKGLQQLKKGKRISDEMYVEEMKNWMLEQFEGKE